MTAGHVLKNEATLRAYSLVDTSCGRGQPLSHEVSGGPPGKGFIPLIPEDPYSYLRPTPSVVSLHLADQSEGLRTHG